MKKTISVLLAVLLVLGAVFAFAACSDKTDETTTAANTEETTAAESDLQYITDKGVLVVGITEYPPMDYLDENNEWTGFDAEYAKLVAEKIGVDVEFVEITWSQKVFELDAKKIDVVWNGMTINDDLKKSMSITDPYVKNAQVIVMAADKAEQYKTIESMAELNFAVEEGSAGKDVAEENSFSYTGLPTQADALLEVSTGKADACIIDLTMADATTGEGSSYENLVQVMAVNEEEYGVGCRTGSDLCDKINEITDELIADGTLTALAEKYELTLVD
ncbi:MAG: transporter substrate-binding domain-containing protein [Clostridia bacterium]|nr:transporter substrate-binding domain-containing protein [Clostridia bacterium]